MSHPKRTRGLFAARANKATERRDRRRTANLIPTFEGLEQRVVLSQDNWISTTGGDWDTGTNWSTGSPPTVQQDAAINLTAAGIITHSMNMSDSALSLTTNSNTTLKLTSGSIALGSDTSTLGGPTLIVSGTTLSVGAGASLVVGVNQTLNVEGTMNLGSGDTVSLPLSYGTTTQILVSGTLNATSTAFLQAGATNNSLTQIAINCGGRFTTSGSNFTVNSLTVDSGGTLNLTTSQFSNQIALNSGGTFSVSGNEFSNIGANVVVASGDANATIPLTGNDWGTTVIASIHAKIDDHLVSASLPLIHFQPFLSATSGTIATLSSNVTGGSASGSFILPAGTSGGTYSSQATYTDLTDFQGSSGRNQLVVQQAPTSVAVTNSTTAYSPNGGTSLNLSAQLSSPDGTINEGAATFTVVNGTSATIGMSVSGPVTSDYANTSYLLPANLPAGTYTIQVSFNGSTNYAPSTVATGSLVVTSVTTTGTADPASATDSTAAQNLALSASVSSTSGAAVSVGTVTFHILSGTTLVGSAQTVGVVNDLATCTYSLPAGQAAGSYTVSTTFAGTVAISGSSDSSKNLIIAKATPIVVTSPVSVLYNNLTGQSVPLSASVSGPGGVVNPPGSVTYQIYSGSTAVGAPVTVGVTNGLASASYNLPAGLAAGSYTISTAFAGTANLSAYTDRSATLVLKVVKASTTAALSTSTTSASLGQSVTLNAAVTSIGSGAGIPTGTVSFLDGALLLGTTTLNATGQASLVLPRLGLGTHPITVSYSGDGFDSSSVSSGTSVYVGDLPKDDYDGDGKADIAIYGKDPVSGLYRFEILTSSTGFNPAKAIIFNNNGYGYGNAQSIPVPGDYFGDGRDAYALWTPNAYGGMTFTAVSSVTSKSISMNFGGTTDIPIVADVDGDGKADFGVYGYQAGLNYRFDFLLSSANFASSSQLIFNNNGYGYGGSTTIPVVADFDGSGKAGFGLFTPSTSVTVGPQGNPVTGPTYTASTFSYVSSTTSFSRTIGTQYDIPEAVDLDGDGKADLVLFGPDPARSGHYRYLALTSSSNFSVATPVFFDNNGFGYGNSSSVPTVDDYEGTGKADFSVFTPDFSGGMEVVYQSSQTGNGVLIDFASATDIDLSSPLYLRARKVRGQ